MNVSEMLRSVGETLGATAGSRNVYGEPVTAGERTVIPVARVRYGFGGGLAPKGDAEGGGGGGGGVVAAPCGLVEITPEGTRFIRFHEPEKFAAAVVAGFLAGVLLAVWNPFGRE